MIAKIIIDGIYYGNFEDYKDKAEDIASDKLLPVQFEYGGYLYTVEKKK